MGGIGSVGESVIECKSRVRVKGEAPDTYSEYKKAGVWVNVEWEWEHESENECGWKWEWIRVTQRVVLREIVRVNVWMMMTLREREREITQYLMRDMLTIKAYHTSVHDLHSIIHYIYCTDSTAILVSHLTLPRPLQGWPLREHYWEPVKRITQRASSGVIHAGHSAGITTSQSCGPFKEHLKPVRHAGHSENVEHI